MHWWLGGSALAFVVPSVGYDLLTPTRKIPVAQATPGSQGPPAAWPRCSLSLRSSAAGLLRAGWWRPRCASRRGAARHRSRCRVGDV